MFPLSHTYSSLFKISFSEFTTDKAAAVKHCAALGLYVFTFWRQDIYERHRSERADGTWCTAAHFEHLGKLDGGVQQRRMARDFLNYYTGRNIFRKKLEP